MTIRAILFDLWGTLIEDAREHTGTRRADLRVRLLSEALTAAGRSFPGDAIRDAFPPFIEAHGALHAEGRDLSVREKVELFLHGLSPGLGGLLAPHEIDRVEEAFVSPGRLNPPLPAPGAVDALAEARRLGLRTGLVSNTGFTPGYLLRELLVEYEMRPYLEVLTFSDEARACKPAPEVFACTLEALGVAPADAVFVGDMPELDVRGPRDMGMWTVLIGARTLDGVEPHARIDALHELFPALKGLGLLG